MSDQHVVSSKLSKWRGRTFDCQKQSSPMYLPYIRGDFSLCLWALWWAQCTYPVCR